MAIPRNLSNLAPGASSTGVLDVTKGGTGLTSVGTSGQVLQSNGTSLTWATPSSGAMSLVSTQTLSGGANLVEWTGLSGTYFRIEYKNLYFGTAQYWLRLQGGTSSYVTSGYTGYVNYMGPSGTWSAQSNGTDAFYLNILNDPTTQKYFGYIDILPASPLTSIIGVSNYAQSGSAPTYPAISIGSNTSLNNPTRFKLESTNGGAPLYGTFSLYSIT